MLLTVIILFAKIGNAQPSDFEQFRLQHKAAHWQVYTTPAYDLYYQKDNDSLVAEVLYEIQSVIKEIEDSLFANNNKKLNIILYPSVADLQESNIGISADRLLPIGSKRFTGNRVLVAYKGSENVLRQDLKEKLLAQYIQQRIYGEGLSSFLKSVNEKTIPKWFKESVPAYYSKGWTVADDLAFRKILLTPIKKTFLDLTEMNPRFTGKALLYYLTETKRRGATSNFILSVLKGKTLIKSAQLVYKEPLWELQQSALVFFVNRYLNDNRNVFSSKKTLNSFAVPKGVIQLICSPNSDKVAILSKQNEQYNIKVINTKSKKQYRVLQIADGEVFQEEQLPILKWSVKGQQEQLGVVYNEKGKLKFRQYRFGKGVQPIRTSNVSLEKINGVQEIAFTPNQSLVYFSAYQNGLLDIYKLKGIRLSKITNSKNEELGLVYGKKNGESGLSFIADYPTDTIYSTIQKNKMSQEQKLFYLNDKKLKVLSAQTKPYVISNTEGVLSRKIQTTSVSKIKKEQAILYHLSNENGFSEIVKQEGVQIEVVARVNENILDYKIKGAHMLSYILQNDSIIERSSLMQGFSNAKSILAREKKNKKNQQERQRTSSKKNKKKTGLNLFGANQTAIKKYRDSLEQAKSFQMKNRKPYRLKLVSDYTSASLSNNLLMNRYQSYAFNQGLFHQANIGGLVQYAFSDLFENYKVSAGVRLPSNGKGSDFFVSYENRKKMLDWGISYQRHVEKFTLNNNSDWLQKGGVYYPPYIKQKTNYIEGFVRNPFNKSSALKMSLGLKQDRQVFIASDTFSLYYPDTTQIWSVGRLEYQIDKSKKVQADIYKGFRARAFFEYHLQVKKGAVAFMHFGFDARYYLGLYKNIIWANRIQAATSGGDNLGIMYTLGGTQNQMAPLVDSSVKFSPLDDYSLIAYATGLRGYAQNIRYGNTYALLNSEVRIPVLNTFFNIQTKLNSLNHLKFVVFGDVANAWNRKQFDLQQIPKWAMSYGLGLHTNLLNYQIRMDVAWQTLNQNKVRKPLFVFSLGQNF